MRIAFRAIDGGFFDDDFALVCGVHGPAPDGSNHQLSFDRVNERIAQEQPTEDWGVHVEFDDQINGGYGLVRQCRLSRGFLSVDLSEQLGPLAGVEGFDVELAIDDEAYGQVREGLQRIFRAMPGTFVILP